VHEFVLRDRDHVDASTAYQIRVPLDLVQTFEPRIALGDEVRLLLPFTIRPKDLLLNVDFAGVRGAPAALLLRQEAAELQAQYIAHVDGRPLSAQPLGGALWIGVSAYTKSAWREHVARTRPWWFRRKTSKGRDRWRIAALTSYLNSDLALAIDRADVSRWLGKLDGARQLLVDALEEGPDPESASECVLLAIPFMPFRPQRIRDIDTLVSEFDTAVQSMSADARQVVAEYGRRWEAVVDTTVPVGVVCSIKLSEQRPWLGAPSSTMEQEIAFGDATTTHVEIRAADHGVVLDRPTISDLVGERVGVAVGDSMRQTEDAIAIYASDSVRPYFARVSVRARVRFGVRVLILWLLALIAAAGLVAVQLPEDDDLVDSLSLLTFPLTLAGALVLTRETTTLAERLLRRWKTGLVVAVALLWTIALVKLLLNADVGWAEELWREARASS
jgi:hypothetical protein